MARGFTLLEVLVALSLFSLIFFSFSAAQHLLVQQAKHIATFFYAKQEIQNLSSILQLKFDNSNLFTVWQEEFEQNINNPKVTLEEDKITLLWGSGKMQACSTARIGENGCVYKKISRSDAA